MKANVKDFVNLVERAYAEKWGYIWATAGETWTETKQRNLEAKYNSNPIKYEDYASGAKYGAKWIGHIVTDCSGLPKRALNKLGIKGIYHGSNSQFNKNCSKTGKIEKGVKIPVGALIFTGNAVGQHNHVGVLVTETCVCEAQGTQKGVVHTPLSNKKWTYWGLLKDVDYESTNDETVSDNDETPVTVGASMPTIRKGTKGDVVVTMQKLLLKAGEKLPKYGADGDFGNETLKAVKAFQKKNNLVVDGICGPKTWKALMAYA